MKIREIELREIRLGLLNFFETSFGRTTERRIILVRAVDEDKVEGWGECTAGEGPFYSEEWTETAWPTLKHFLAPTVLGKDIGSASRVRELLSRVRGHRMAKAALETACWDLEARRAARPLWKHLGGVRAEIPCGVSIGIQESVEALLDKIERELSVGYQRIKIKIKSGWDLNVLEAVRGRFPEIQLMADANSAYTLEDAPLFRQMDQYNLMMVEQPLAHDDIMDHARLQAEIATPICLDESIRSLRDARHALDLKACRIINIKLGRVGGHAEASEVESQARRLDIPVWCGGMLESGVGRAHNIAISTLQGFTLPGDVSASSRYWEEDIIDPPVTVTEQGTILAPDAPGLGFEIKRARLDALTVRLERITQS